MLCLPPGSQEDVILSYEPVMRQESKLRGFIVQKILNKAPTVSWTFVISNCSQVTITCVTVTHLEAGSGVTKELSTVNVEHHVTVNESL